MDYRLLFKTAMLAGEIMLRNGAETYRVEDTINRILRTSNFEDIESFVTPTGLFATLDDPSIEMITYVKRVDNRTIHLNKVAVVNDISRKYCNNHITLKEAYSLLLTTQKEMPYNNVLMTFAIGLAAGFFTIVFGGTIMDALLSTLIGIGLSCLQIWLKKKITLKSKFFYDLIGGSLIAILAIIFNKYLHLGSNFDIIIIGSIMPLVPGVAITNAVRDTLEGELVSGISRGIEALIIASSIAVGVGIVLKAYYVYGGY